MPSEDSYRFAYRRYRLKFKQPVRTARTLWTEREGLIVRLEASDGRVGWGEAAPVPAFGMEPMGVLEAAAQSWLHFDPATAPTLANALANARSEVEGGQVISDPAGGQARGERKGRTPAGEECQVISALPEGEEGQVNSALPVAALLPAGRGAVEVVKAKAEAGYRTFKWKVGVEDWSDEFVVLDDVCAAMPDGSRLRLDANGVWDRRVAERWLERCGDRPVEFIEQPTDWTAKTAEDLLFGLAGDYPTPIALDESLIGERDVERWIGNGWPGIYVIKPSLLADPRSAIDRLSAAKAKVVFSSALETGLGARAALRLAFSWAGPPLALGFGVWPIFDDRRFDGPASAPFLRRRDLDVMEVEQIWNALN